MPAGTLRVWTARYGFPDGERGPGGHHRFTDKDLDAVRAVQRLRDEGMSLAASILHVTEASSAPDASIYAALRRRRPDLRPFVLRKTALLELSHAIEDEHCARAGSGLLLASFQEERHYRASQHRWRELARTVSCAVAMADFAELRTPTEGPIEVPLPRGHQLGREWTLIVDSPEARACLCAWEVVESGDVADRARRFEVIWSFEPSAVADATAAARALVVSVAPEVARQIPTDRRPLPSAADDNFGVDLATRALGYLADVIQSTRRGVLKDERP